jgi:outer membrane protein TolC
MRTIYIFIFSLFFYPAFTQTGNSLALADCYRIAIENAPLQQRRALVQQGHSLRLASIDASKYPTLDLNAQASIQSEVVELPFEAPGIPGLDLPLYRFQSTVDAQYTIYDGGIRKARESAETTSFQAQAYQIDVELDRQKEQVLNLYFGILRLEESVVVLETTKKTLLAKQDQLEAALEHGVVLESDVDALSVEILKLDARITEAQGKRRSLITGLSEVLQTEIAPDTKFERPTAPLTNNQPLQRKEITLFGLQKQQIAANESLITARKKPKLGAFLQAGVGYPNPLNFFEAELSPFAIGGVRFSWNIWDWDQSKRDRELLTVQQLTVDNQQDIFEQQIDIATRQLQEDITTQEALLVQEQAIVALEEKIVTQKSSQLDNGVITSSDYIEQVNKAQVATQQLKQREVQIQQLKAHIALIMGQ